MSDLHRFRDIHTHDENAGSDSVISIRPGQALRPGRHYSAGVHPWDTSDIALAERLLGQLPDLLDDPRVVAVGECGFDRLRGGGMADQERIFVRQAELAERAGLPLIIHCVRAYDVLLRLRRELRPTQEWIIHGFRGKPELARQLLRAGFSLSYGKNHNSESMAITPPERRYCESDSPGE